MKITVLLMMIIFGSVLFSGSNVYSQTHLAATDTINRRDTVEEQIWALEKAYFTNLYKADYEGVLALVDSHFLGWPGGVKQPIDKEESARFMKQLIPGPTSCTIRIERDGIRVAGGVALTQYILHVSSSDSAGATKTQLSRITHTWVKRGGSWKLLGGMSSDN